MALLVAGIAATTSAACSDDRGDPNDLVSHPRDAGALLPPGADAGPAVLSTLAILPDTQYYSSNFPHVFVAQTSWIVAHAAERSIPYVLQLGDIVDNNSPGQWRRAADALQILDGVVPYAVVGGNHDYGPGGSAATRDTLLNDYLPYARTAALPSFGGAYQPGKLDNTFHFVSLGGRDYIVIALEWGPRDAVVAWADQVMLDHPHHYGILITHAYLYSDSRRYDYARDGAVPWNPHLYNTAGGVNDGEELWQKLVRRHAFAFVFNGHVLNEGTGYLASVTDKGNICHQMLSNYQDRRQGGEGYMRLLEFLDDARTVRVTTYSPLLDDVLGEPGHNFTVTLDLPPGPKP